MRLFEHHYGGKPAAADQQAKLGGKHALYTA